MAKKTDEKEKEKQDPVAEEAIPIEVVDEESASDSDNVLPLIVSYERVMTDLTVDEFLALKNHNVEGCKKVLSRYVGDGNGRLLDPKDAMKLIGELKIINLSGLIASFFEQLNEVVVPKVSGSDSEST